MREVELILTAEAFRALAVGSTFEVHIGGADLVITVSVEAAAVQEQLLRLLADAPALPGVH